MKNLSKKICFGLIIVGTIMPLFAFAQVVNNPADNPANFQTPTNTAGGGVTSAPSTSFSLVPCNAPPGVNTDPLGSGNPTTPCDFAAFMTLVQRFINLLLYAAVFIAVIMILLAGYNYLTAGGDTGKVKKAHNIFKATAIGMIIAFCSWVIVNTIVTAVIDTNFGGGSSNITLLGKQ